MAHRPGAKPCRGDRQRHHQGGAAEILCAETAESRIGHEFQDIGDGKEHHIGAGENLRVHPKRQQIDLQRRRAGMGDEAGVTRKQAPEPSCHRPLLRNRHQNAPRQHDAQHEHGRDQADDQAHHGIRGDLGGHPTKPDADDGSRQKLPHDPPVDPVAPGRHADHVHDHQNR